MSGRRFRGLWRNRDFLHLWSADTVSIFGSLITTTALPFTAILALHATPFEVALITTGALLPAMVFGLPAGVLLDRLPRKPVLIACDVGQALVVGSLPLAAFLDSLRLEQLYVVAFLAGTLAMVSNVGQASFLPSVVAREDLVEANAKMSATRSVAEVGGFGIAGWLVQLLTGPGAILIDAISFAVSAALLFRVRTVESPRATTEEGASLVGDVIEGLRAVRRSPVLVALVGSAVALEFAFGVFGALISVFALRDLNVNPGLLGMIYGIGGASSLVGSVLVARATTALGVGPTMIAGLVVYGISLALVPLAAPGVMAAGLLSLQQLGDGAITIFLTLDLSLRQTLAPPEALARVNATTRTLGLASMLVGTLLSGGLAELVGVREAMALGAVAVSIGAVFLLFSPVRSMRQVPLAEPSPVVEAAAL